MELKENRVLLYIDIAGFTDWIEKSSLEVVHDSLSFAFNSVSAAGNLLAKFNDNLVFNQVFSDSIFLVLNCPKKEDLLRFFEAISHLYTTFLEREILIKGVISYGEILVDKSNNIIIGKPIIDAVKLEKNLKQFSIVLDRSAEALVKSFKIRNYCGLVRGIGNFSERYSEAIFITSNDALKILQGISRPDEDQALFKLENTINFLKNNSKF